MLEIRKAYPTDAYTLINIHDITWKNEYYDILPNGILNNMLQNIKTRVHHLQDQINENNRIYVALEDNNLVGYIFYAKSQNGTDEVTAEIREIYILPEYQQQGIGTKLFENVTNEIKQLGYKALILYCPLNSKSINFFQKIGGEKRKVVAKNNNGYSLNYDLIEFTLDNLTKNNELTNWNNIYEIAQENLHLLNDINKEIAVISTSKGNLYMGLSIKNNLCPIESALSNMYLNEEKQISKILILNRQSKPVLPCGKCRDLLISLKQENAEILFDFGTLKTITIKELNPYYKDEEKV